MRKNKHFVLGTAALLLSTAGFTACSSDDAFTGSSLSGEAVKTQFAINIPAGKAVSGRLSQDIVQGQPTPVFRGMDNIKLIPFTTTPAADGTGGKIIGLGAILSDELAAQTNAKVYYDVEIAQGVNNFLFYGEAKAAEGSDDKTNGALVPAGLDGTGTSTSVNTITFSLKPMVQTSTGIPQAAKDLAGALTTLANSQSGSAQWSTSSLKNFYSSLIRLKAGSANSIKQALLDLQDGLTPVSSGLTGDESTLLTEINDNITAALAVAENKYPRDLNLPDGAAQVKWNSATNQFDVVNEANIGNLSYTSLDKFVYPSSLYYWVNTPIKTSNTPLASQFAGKTSWADCLILYNGGGTSVTAQTSSVALEKAIQYAVARLDVSAYFNGDVTDNLQQTVAVTANGGITLDGILIGGQKNVIWDFTPNSSSAEYTIYDASVTSTQLKNSVNTDVIAQSLALQTADGTSVNFALELTNNTGNAFTGIDGIVPNGGRFYLVGKLVPEQSGNTKVFKQDFTTTAKVKITSLAHAYNCIPDLKNPKLELGLSVDLTWQAGLSQEVIIE